jgi:hypothetical protein
VIWRCEETASWGNELGGLSKKPPAIRRRARFSRGPPAAPCPGIVGLEGRPTRFIIGLSISLQISEIFLYI